jgi:hypothetical protein
MIKDGDWSLFDYDFQTKRQIWRRSNSDGSSTYRTDYHVDDVLAQNHAERMDNAGKRMGDWVKVASVPLALHHSELAAAQSQLDGKYIDNWLDENSAFRTW